MSKKYIASVTDKESKEKKIIESEYNSKENFRKDLTNNGYSINNNFIFSEKQFEYYMSKDFVNFQHFTMELKEKNIK